MVILYCNVCVAHIGSCNVDATPGQARMGVVCRQATSSGKGNNLANLARYPGLDVPFASLVLGLRSVLCLALRPVAHKPEHCHCWSA